MTELRHKWLYKKTFEYRNVFLTTTISPLAGMELEGDPSKNLKDQLTKIKQLFRGSFLFSGADGSYGHICFFTSIILFSFSHRYLAKGCHLQRDDCESLTKSSHCYNSITTRHIWNQIFGGFGGYGPAKR